MSPQTETTVYFYHSETNEIIKSKQTDRITKAIRAERFHRNQPHLSSRDDYGARTGLPKYIILKKNANLRIRTET